VSAGYNNRNFGIRPNNFEGFYLMRHYAGKQTGTKGLFSHKKQWVINCPAENIQTIAKSLKISNLLAQVLVNRGITETSDGLTFLRPKLTSLISPESMPGVPCAVERIKQSILKKEKITIYGDYDVDGITGVAILFHLLTFLGANVDYYIPHRIDEGYGLNEDAVRGLSQAGTKLLITVDCGIGAVTSASLAAELGTDLIITDHHRPGQQLPQAFVIVHPALDSSYPNPDSSGAMVAFKLAWAIANKYSAGPRLDDKLREFMLNATSLAAMGTIADIVDLRGENRILTSFGLKSLSDCKLCGITALIETAGLTGQGLNSFDIGFKLAPMINAAGRMGHARLAVELLTCQTPVRAMQIADYLKAQNVQRQQCERKIFKQACEMITQKGFDHPDRRTIVLANEDWHTGVIGVVASRIVDKFYRPAIMFNTTAATEGLAQGSARSVAGFDILNAISACSKHLVHFGGHAMAAGITIKTDNIDKFAKEFENYAAETIDDRQQVASLNIDAVVPLSEFRPQVVKELEMLEPFGQGNPKPVFATKGVRLAAPPRKVGAKGDHLQLAITDNTSAVRCIGFQLGNLEKKLIECDCFNVAYHPKINTFNGNSNVELVIADVQLED
jgi:single-stranded-DNA-specific exonuclease